MGGNPEKPSWWCFRSHPFPLWPQGDDVDTGALWDSSVAALHCVPPCPVPLPSSRQGRDSSSSCCWHPACGCWGTPLPKDCLTRVQWEAHRDQAGKEGVETQIQTSSSSFLSLLAVLISDVPTT